MKMRRREKSMSDIPKGYKELERVTSVYVSDREIVVTGVPGTDDETHNCDFMGCSSVSHVIFRSKI
jgi:deoxycytidylate deaminase